MSSAGSPGVVLSRRGESGRATVLTVDIDGRPGRGPCWNHPHYREWVFAAVRDLVTRYPLDGLQYGAERTGPLSNLLFRGRSPSFCRHCRARLEGKGIDPERARRGFEDVCGSVHTALSPRPRVLRFLR